MRMVSDFRCLFGANKMRSYLCKWKVMRNGTHRSIVRNECLYFQQQWLIKKHIKMLLNSVFMHQGAEHRASAVGLLITAVWNALVGRFSLIFSPRIIFDGRNDQMREYNMHSFSSQVKCSKWDDSEFKHWCEYCGKFCWNPFISFNNLHENRTTFKSTHSVGIERFQPKRYIKKRGEIPYFRFYHFRNMKMNRRAHISLVIIFKYFCLRCFCIAKFVYPRLISLSARSKFGMNATKRHEAENWCNAINKLLCFSI